MNWRLAQRLLANVMQWTPQEDAKERPILQSLAALKYDDYENFSPGMRFIESLALWLKQFRTIDERRIAYSFVRNNLIFISRKEMYHLVTVAYPDFIRPYLLKQVSPEIGVKSWEIKRILESTQYKVCLRKSLFLALSDGAHIDEFRRSNQDISNEQILRSQEIFSERAKEMVSKLKEELTPLIGHEPTEQEAKFRFVFLIDDFSGSGFSCKGKILKFIHNAKNELKDLFDIADSRICLVLYIASARAVDCLKVCGKNLMEGISFDVLIVNTLPDNVRIDERRDNLFVELLKNYYDSNIETTHYKRVDMKGHI